ncbi:ABC transporter permease [Neptunicella marina]|uniref:ABC transporter permease subunit n=1 Tax=Neptunicella marina TaxID=2125989 RepID=A0A8J6IVN8_9ALTE|nr:ABC transporter permease subunit [Neptunicella marina]MBC3766436.1 ABC transporter permease subunit [Neptunicella marina]
MIAYLLRRLNLFVVTIFVVTLATFALNYLFPGDTLENLSGISSHQTAEYNQIVQYHGFDHNIVYQYGMYLQHLWKGDWGISSSSGNDIVEEIKLVLPATLELSVYAMVLSLFIGIPFGFWAGLRHRRPIDLGILSASVLGYSIPVFWLALLLILFFALQLGWLPMSGRISLLYDIPHYSGFILIDILKSDIPNKQDALSNAIRHMILPTLSIALVTATIVIRITRRSVADVMQSDYIRAALARGLTRPQVFWRHGLRNTLLPILPQLVLQFTTLLTNAMIVEVIFSWPGIGNWLMQAVYVQDFPAIRGGVLAVSIVVIIFTLLMDIVLRVINPLKNRDIHGTI